MQRFLDHLWRKNPDLLACSNSVAHTCLWEPVSRSISEITFEEEDGDEEGDEEDEETGPNCSPSPLSVASVTDIAMAFPPLTPNQQEAAVKAGLLIL